MRTRKLIIGKNGGLIISWPLGKLIMCEWPEIRNAPQAKSIKLDMSLISTEFMMGVPALGTEEVSICSWLQKKAEECSQILTSS